MKNKLESFISKLSYVAIGIIYISPIAYININNFNENTIFWGIILILEITNIIYRLEKRETFESTYLYLKNKDISTENKLKLIEKLIEEDKNIV